MKRFFLRALWFAMLALAGSSAFCQTLDNAEFARGLQELIEAAGGDFSNVRAETFSRDEKGTSTAWRSLVQIGGADVTIYANFATIRLGRYSDAASARKAYGDAVKLVRATLPAEWKPAGESTRKGEGGVEIGRATFQREKLEPRVWVAYTGTPSTGVVTVNVGNTPARLRADKDKKS
jgi:hypothetical protein